jgi:hypothetical protein
VTDQLDLWPEDAPGGRFVWSVTRAKRLQTCRRRYFLQHYGSRGGGKSDAPPQVRDVYVLKHLRNRHMWVGEVVHEMVELALGAWRRGDSVPVEALVERGTRRMRAQYAESMQGVYRDRPRHAYGLVEHEYRDDISREEWQAQRDRMERCLRNFFELDLTASIRASPAWRWLALETTGSYGVDGNSVLVRPDFALRRQDDSVAIIDWKTGAAYPEDEWLQMAAYGIFAQRAWGLDQEPLVGTIAYLDDGQTRDIPIEATDLARVEGAIRDSIREMRKLSALAPPEGELDPPAFPKTGDRGACRRCAFRRACDRLAEATSPR